MSGERLAFIRRLFENNDGMLGLQAIYTVCTEDEVRELISGRYIEPTTLENVWAWKS